MSMSASLRNWWYMLGSFLRMCSFASDSRRLSQLMSRKTPPCGLPRPSRISRTMHLATWSRVSSSGGLREHVAVAGVLPGVAGDLVGLAHSPGGEDDRPGAEHMEEPALPVIPERAGHPLAVLEQREHRVLHVHVDALVDAVILERPD